MTRRAGTTTADLLSGVRRRGPSVEAVALGATVLRDFAGAEAAALLAMVQQVAAAAPFRRMVTPGGFQMSVAMTNCGCVGWVTDRRGYRYAPLDPLTERAWPAMPAAVEHLAARAAAAAGFAGFAPDSCLINRYEAGSRLSLHQDRNERDFEAPIVSVSLGLPAVFLFGGLRRNDRPRRLRLESGDIVVWGGPARLAFHGVDPLPEGDDPLTGRCRINLTLRKAL
jgi:alkylated DNA repair protein (DNA oxidative demethylase)